MSPYSFAWENDLSRLAVVPDFLSTVHGATLFTSPEWLTCAAAFLPPQRALHVLHAFRNDTLVACLPLTRGRETIHNLPVTSLRFLGDPLADRIALPIDRRHKEILPELFDRLLQAPFRWDVLLFNEVTPDRQLREMLERWSLTRQAGIHWQHCSRTPILPLPYRNTAELRAAYPKSLATRLRRSRRKLAASGCSEFRRLLPTPEEATALLAGLKEVEDISWKGTQGIGIFSTAERFAFFRRLASDLAARKELDIGLLLEDGKLISYRFGFRFRNIFLDYNLAFHPDWAAVAPGRILLEEMIASSVDLGLEAIDASRSGLFHAHQLQEWTEEKIDHFQLWVFNRTVRGRALNLLHTRIRPALKKMVEPERADASPVTVLRSGAGW